MRNQFPLSGCRAIITGASSGLGAEFARQLAPVAEAFLLTARRGELLEALKAELLAARPGLVVECCPCDIATAEGRETLVAAIDRTSFKPNLLINNAGHGDYGPFLSADPARIESQIDLNVTALVLLTQQIVPRLIRSAARPAAILNVSSLASMIALPDNAVYAATKAFVTSFSEAMRIEFAAEHILVTATCPGPTATGFCHVARRSPGEDTDRSYDGALRLLPQEVVRESIAALAGGKVTVFPGWGVTIAGWLFRSMPRWFVRRLLQRRFDRSRAGQQAARPV